MRVGRDRIEEIGEDDADDRRRGKDAEDPQADARERQHRDPHAAEDDRRAEVRLLHQKHGDRRPAAPPTSGNTGSYLSCSRRLQQPGHGHDEEGLEELGRLKLADADVDPARRAVHLRAEDRDEDQQ